jgi:hypothetical protein
VIVVVDCGACVKGVIHTGSCAGNPLELCPECLGLGFIAVNPFEPDPDLARVIEGGVS